MDPKYPGNPGTSSSGFGMNTGATSAGGAGTQVGSRMGMGDEGGNFDMNMIAQRAEEIGQRLGQLVRDRPVTCLLVAVGAGYLVGRILRA
jgi:hypothetical protein